MPLASMIIIDLLERETMDEIASMQRQPAQAEALLNVLDALRPDLPAGKLNDLALQAFDAGRAAASGAWGRAPSFGGYRPTGVLKTILIPIVRSA